MPPAIINRGIATPSLLAFIITAKYVDGTPLKRQETSFARIGVDLPRQRMADWIMAVGEALAPVMEQLYIELRAGPFLLVDDSRVPQWHKAIARNAAGETTVQVLGEENRLDTSLSYMWCACGGDPDRPVVVYRYAPSRSTKEAHAIVDSYSGIMQTDGYEAYDRLARDRDDLVHAGCWADADIAARICYYMHGASLLMPKAPARKLELLTKPWRSSLASTALRPNSPRWSVMRLLPMLDASRFHRSLMS